MTTTEEMECESCGGTGENWDCLGENDPDECTCKSCTGIPNCQECT